MLSTTHHYFVTVQFDWNDEAVVIASFPGENAARAYAQWRFDTHSEGKYEVLRDGLSLMTHTRD